MYIEYIGKSCMFFEEILGLSSGSLPDDQGEFTRLYG